MATPPANASGVAPAKSDAAVFVDTLYRKVVLSVKASNAIPSEDDDYHYHCKFSTAFASQADSQALRVQELLWRLSKSSNKKADGDASDDEDEEEDAAMSGELFEGPEPKPRITDLVDTLLDEASRQLEIVLRGGNAASSAKRQLENKPMVFDGKQNQKKQDDSNAATSKERAVRSQNQSRTANKPQDKFEETIDNSSVPFVTKLREKVHAIHEAQDDDLEDDSAARHPYFPEIRALKYSDWQVEASTNPYEKISIEDASYLWVDTEEKLVEMMASLVKPTNKVIAVDLEHHSYRSFMGLVCLMQISTAREDFLVDTLALRGKLQVLNQVLCDPARVKVLHGSDMDILWLQRDLGLYIVNLFDTGQAARLLNYPRFSLAYLLKRHCGIDADKQYQLADWRLRPLEKNMVKYAREDTRYLLYIYDQIKQELLSASDSSRSSLLLEALRNSSKICLQVYEKPELTDDECAALSDKLKATVGIPMLTPLQKSVFRRLCYWRDAVARAEDESHAYVMPNHVLIKIATQLPLRSDQLFRTCHPVPALVRKHAHEITSMIAAEKTKAAAEETKKVTVTTSRDVVMSEVDSSQRIHKRKFSDEDMVTATFSSASELSEYAGWQSGKRKARVATAVELSSTVLPGLSLSLSRCAVADASTPADSDAAEALRQVNELVTSTSFVVTDYTIEHAVVAPPATETRQKTSMTMDTVPQSLTDEYQLSNRDKRRKMTPVVPKTPSSEAIAAVQASADETKQRTETFIKQISSTEAPKRFDYAAASQQVAGAQFKLEAPVTGGRGGRGGKKQGGRGRGGGRGYNPFVAVRGGKTDGLEEPLGAKAPVKKIHQMPRSSTFQ